MSRDVDVLILGGGPAGAALAALTASAGVRTLVVERARFPRDKVCGEFVSSEGCDVLRRLGLLPRLLERGARWMDACRVTESGGASLDVALPELERSDGRALGISRAVMDTELLDEAASRGAEVLQGFTAVRPIIDDERVAGFVIRPTSEVDSREIRAALVVAADGRRSVLARRLHPHLGDPRRSGPSSWFGFKAHFRAPQAVATRVELHLFDGGYAGLGAVEGDRVNLCMLTTVRALQDCGGTPERLVARRASTNPALREILRGAERLGGWTTVGPLRFGVRRPAAGGALFVGDAAGTVDPFCGEGMSHALRGAEIALPFVLQAARDGHLGPTEAGAYADAWKRAFCGSTRRNRMLGRVFQRPRLARPLMRLLGGPASALLPRVAATTRTGGGL